MTWTDVSWAFEEKPVSSTKLNQMHANHTAMANGDSGAPPLKDAALESTYLKLVGSRTSLGSFTGLDGDTDLFYHLIINGIATATATIELRFNADSGNNYSTIIHQSGRLGAVAEHAVYYTTADTQIRFTTHVQQHLIECWIGAKTGQPRAIIAKYSGIHSTEDNFLINNMVGKWSNTSSNITSINLTGNVNTFFSAKLFKGVK